MLPDELRPLKIDEKNLIRIGPNMDGGYVLDKRIIKDIETIITCGLSDDWGFEKHFLKLKPNVNIAAYDHTVNNYFWAQRFLKDILHFFLLKKLRISKIIKIFKFLDYKFFFRGKKIHHKLKVGESNILYNEITINEILKNKKNVLLKVDIECDEYKILKNIIENSEKIDCLLIEFHQVKKNIEQIKNFIKENKILKLIHIHGNNYANIDNQGMPAALELTFINSKKININNEKNTNFYPIKGIDYPNIKRHKDVKLTFEN